MRILLSRSLVYQAKQEKKNKNNLRETPLAVIRKKEAKSFKIATNANNWKRNRDTKTKKNNRKQKSVINKKALKRRERERERKSFIS